MKKENIQSRNRKLSAKARKKHSSFTSAADMLKPLEKMYGYGAMAAGMPAGMSSYYMPHSTTMPPSAAMAHTTTSQYAATAAAGMHMMAASTLGGFGAAAAATAAPSFGGMVSKERSRISLGVLGSKGQKLLQSIFFTHSAGVCYKSFFLLKLVGGRTEKERDWRKRGRPMKSLLDATPL